MSYYDIIHQPVISEKAYAGMERGVYSFWVSPKATKTEIKSAIQRAFGVSVVGISTMNVRGKQKRVGRFIGTAQRPQEGRGSSRRRPAHRATRRPGLRRDLNMAD